MMPAEHLRPSRTAPWALSWSQVCYAARLCVTPSPDPQYQGRLFRKRVLDLNHAISAFIPGVNKMLIAHGNGTVLFKLSVTHNLRTTAGLDWEAQVLGGGNAADSGTNTSATTGTTLTDTGKAWTVNAWKDHTAVTTGASGGLVAGRILSNTATGLTIDRWTNLATLQTQMGSSASGNGTAGNPNTGATQPYAILPGAWPALYLALDTSGTTPASGSTYASLTEPATAGMTRTPLSFAHTPGATSYTMTKTVTNTSGGTTTGPINNLAMMTTETGTGTVVFYSAMPNPCSLSPGDSVVVTWPVNI